LDKTKIDLLRDDVSDKTTSHAGSDASFDTNDLKMRKLGDFEILHELGRGGMGVVYRAIDHKLGRQVALKVLPSHAGISRVQLERFQIEARAAAQLNHENIVPVYRVGNEDGTNFFAMKLVTGRNLSQVVRSLKSAVHGSSRGKGVGSKLLLKRNVTTAHGLADSTHSGPAFGIDLSQEAFVSSIAHQNSKSTMRMAKAVATAGAQVARALEHAHLHGVVHRDIKPSNLLLDHDGKVWVTDFGLAQLQSSPSLTRTGDIIGTLRYMSPEQASGRRGFVDNRTDIYSLGVTLYELSTLRRACRGRSARDILREITFERPVPVRRINPSLPADFETIISKATERNPNERYQSASELAEDLERFIQGKSPTANPPSKLKRGRDWLYDRPLVALLIGVCSLVSLFALGTTAWALGSMVQQQRRTLVIERQAAKVLQEAYSESESRRLLAESALQRDQDPALSLALARKGIPGAPGITANQTILKALSNLREIRTVFLDDPFPGQLAISSNDRWFAKGVDGRYFSDGDHRLELLEPDREQPSASLGQQATTTCFFSPDENSLVTSGSSYHEYGLPREFNDIELTAVTVWAPQNGDLKSRLAEAYAIEVDHSTFSPDGRRAVLPNQGNLVNIYDTRTWDRVGPVLRGHTAPIIHVAYSPDGKRIASWAADSTLRIWNANDGVELAQATRNFRRALDVRLRFSPDSSEVMLLGDGIRIYNTTDLSERFALDGDFAVYTRNGEEILYANRFDRSVYMYSRAAGGEIREYPAESGVTRFILLDNDRCLAIATGKDVSIYDTRTGELEGVCRGHKDFIRDIGPLSTPGQFCTVSWDGTLRIWDIKSDSQRRSFETRFASSSTPSATQSPDGSQALLSTTRNYRTSVRSLEQGEELESFEGFCRAILSDGSLLTATEDELLIWTTNRVLKHRQPLLAGQWPTKAVLRSERSSLLILTIMGDVLEWNLNLDTIKKLNGINDVVTAMCVDPTSSDIWLGLADGQVCLLASNAAVYEVQSDIGSAVGYLDLSRDGGRLLITGDDGRVLEWTEGQLETVVANNKSEMPIGEARYVLDGSTFITHAGTETTKLALWEVAEGQVIASLDVKSILDVSLNANQSKLAFTRQDGGLSVWNLEDLQQVELSEKKFGALRFCRDHLLAVTSPGASPVGESSLTSEASLVEPETILNWNMETGELNYQQPANANIAEILCSVDQQRVFLAGVAYGADLVNLSTGQIEGRLSNHTSQLLLADFSEKDQVVTVDVNGTVIMHDWKNQKSSEIVRHELPLANATLSPDRTQLITTDRVGRSFKIDLLRSNMRELDLPLEGTVQHSIAGDSHQVVSIDGSDTVCLWDMRTSGSETIDFAGGVFAAELSPDSNYAILLRGRERPQVIPSKIYTVEQQTPKGEADAWLLNLDTRESKPIVLEGDVVDAAFNANEKSFALLSNEGTIQVFDVATLTAGSLLRSDVRFQSILASYSNEVLFAATQEKVVGWNLNNSELLWEFDTSKQSLEWGLAQRGGDWMLLLENQRAVRVPVDLLGYLTKHVTRELSAEERRKFLLEPPQPAN
jgi:serine/threonine protein kinase/WD40 repeat protein